mgnify:CR=1 FL=1
MRIFYGDEIGGDIGVKGISFFHVHPTFGKNSGRTYAGDWSLSGPDMETLTDLGANVAYLDAHYRGGLLGLSKEVLDQIKPFPERKLNIFIQFELLHFQEGFGAASQVG